MTKLLMKIALKSADPLSPKGRSAVGKLSGLVGILCNLVLFAGKLLAGILSGALSVTADAMNNLTDASSSIVTLLGFKLAEKPADEDHPYGHARYEYLSGLAVAALIVVIGVELAKTSVEKIINPQHVTFTWLTVGILVASMIVKLWLCLFNGTLGKTIHSTTLAATAQDSRNDVISTGAVLAAGVFEHFSGYRVDGYVGLAVAIFILYSGLQLGRETISPLLGEKTSPELRELIVDYVRSCPKVLGYHDLMVHDYGPGQRFATLHVEMDNREDPLLCHELIDDMERECLKNHNVHMVIHYDPVVMDDPVLDRLRDGVEKTLREVDSRLGVHDFRVVAGGGHTNLVFDVTLPVDMSGREKELRALVEETLSQQEGTKIYAVITFDPMAFNERD